jgi:hypothetical protein
VLTEQILLYVAEWRHREQRCSDVNLKTKLQRKITQLRSSKSWQTWQEKFNTTSNTFIYIDVTCVQNLLLDVLTLINWRVFLAAVFLFVPIGPIVPSGASPPHYSGFTITPRHTTLIMNSLNEWSARHRRLYLTTYITHTRQTTMSAAGFEPVIPARKRPQNHSLYGAATAFGF